MRRVRNHYRSVKEVAEKSGVAASPISRIVKWKHLATTGDNGQT